MKYAENTSVPAEKSRAEIERLLSKYGADKFMSGWEQSRAVIGFRMNGKLIRFVLPLPDRNDKRFKETPHYGYARNDDQVYKAWEQATRQAWRALALVVKAKLEAVESKITTFEDEFMAHIVMPDGKTVGEHLKPSIEEAYKTGKTPLLLPEF